MSFCAAAQVSSLHWDQNETFAQFAGDHSLLPDGYATIFGQLAEGLDIRLGQAVVSVDYSGPSIAVTTSSGQEFKAAKVRAPSTILLTIVHFLSFKDDTI